MKPFLNSLLRMYNTEYCKNLHVSVPLAPIKKFIKFSNQSNWLSINTTSESLLPRFFFFSWQKFR